MPRGVEMIVVLAQLGNMHHAFDMDVVQRNEYAETGDGADRSRKLLADAVPHVIALEPGLDIARRFVGAALGHGAMRAQLLPVALTVAFPRERGFDGAMHHEVRIAPDGRGEMGISLVGEAEMTDVFRAVLRLLQ